VSRQHAEALVADLYNYGGAELETPASAYARRYMRFKLGEVDDPDNGTRSYALNDRAREDLRRRVDAELVR
jgi:hypothetical protein